MTLNRGLHDCASRGFQRSRSAISRGVRGRVGMAAIIGKWIPLMVRGLSESLAKQESRCLGHPS